MTARRVSFAQSGLPLPQARALARRAYGRARGSGGLAPVLIDNVWTRVLLAVDGQPAEVQAELFRRAEHWMVLVEDMSQWPR
jgi:hypothetical protein